MDAKPTDADIVHAAVDTLLLVVAKSVDDLKAFHATLTQLRDEGTTPFPRIAVSKAESIVSNLTKVEQELRDVTIALGL